MAKEPIRKIAFLVDKKELKLLEEACLYGAYADKNLEKAVKEGGKFRLEFLFDELEDLAGYIASCANHEKAEGKQDRWDKLGDRIEGLLRLSDRMSRSNSHRSTKHKDGKYPPQMTYYTFNICIEKKGGTIFPGDVRRKIRLPGSRSLYNFAKIIIKTFGFYFDHCFGYYDNFQRYHDSKKAYELFVDIGEEPLSPITKSVKKTQVCRVFQKPGDKMLFLFDYGDGWYFGIELKEITHIDKWNLNPVVLESIGKAPLQYPPCEEGFERE
ncbi:MAG: hypothetical protein ISS45_08040 [Candidatus Omnitrophica bacterium]|nr:hypothetical protein [Candidatus Omnitrophota bacterium]